MLVTIRPEEPRDRARVFAIHEAAFGSPAEARLIDLLRARARPQVSLVAETGVEKGHREVVGHVFFSPVEIVSPRGRRAAIALGPVGVDPRCQRDGVGSALCRAGLDACRAIGEDVVFVLGHPAYYPRFGFEPARRRGLYYRDERFDAAFFAVELAPGALDGLEGEVVYRPEFDAL